MTSNLIKLRVSHAIQGIYVSCCKTSLHWAGKMRNERKHACTDILAKRRTNFCNNYIFAACNNLLISCKI